MGQQFGDTTMTKVFVGGLAWETQKDALGEHFEKYGVILEAVIISDKVTGRSKGYGFVTFKEAESAKKACEDATPMINGRRANCNLASLGARRNRVSPPATPVLQPRQPVAGPRGLSGGPPAHWYYHPSGAPPQQQHASAVHYPGVLPYYAASYGYSPSYMADLGYSTKVSNSGAGGTYVQGQYSYPAPSAMVPMYPPMYHYHHQSQNMGPLPPHFFPPNTTTIPTIISKPTAIPATPVHLAMEQATSCS